jgi:hypothetical protein
VLFQNKTEAAKARKRSQADLEPEDDKDNIFKRKRGDRAEVCVTAVFSLFLLFFVIV